MSSKIGADNPATICRQSGQMASNMRAQSHYDPSEVLSDAIATVVFMPSKFERTTIHLAEKFNGQIGDSQSLSDLVTTLVEQCLREDQFLNLAGRLCSYLAQNVSLDFDGVTLKSLLIQKYLLTHI